MNEKLKPCPFCGGEAKLICGGEEKRIGFDYGCFVFCTECYIRTDIYRKAHKQTLIKDWNKRVKE